MKLTVQVCRSCNNEFSYPPKQGRPFTKCPTCRIAEAQAREERILGAQEQDSSSSMPAVPSPEPPQPIQSPLKARRFPKPEKIKPLSGEERAAHLDELLRARGTHQSQHKSIYDD